MSKGGFMKDAVILCAITLVAGACLGGVYEMTKDPIAAANQAAKEAAYRTVFPDAAGFEAADLADKLPAANETIATLGYGNVSVDEAVEHINRYNTGHSEAIVTKDYANARKFLDEVDAAAVYVNASTRFTDGFEFGFGAEIGISTQKLHARGPMGLKELTTTKYVIYGDGQIRE